MKKILFTALACVVLNNALHSQQNQDYDEPFTYEVAGLVYVWEYDINSRVKTNNQKIPKEPLAFTIVSREKDPVDNSIYYVIRFFPIDDEANNKRAAVQALKGSSTFVNSTDNDKYFWIRKDNFEQYIEDNYIRKAYKIFHTVVTTGANVSLPFKYRPKHQGQNVKITPDIAVGGYLGLRIRISKTKPYYLHAPIVNLGLATLTVNENSSNDPEAGDGNVLGITGGFGGVFQLRDFQIGLMMGWDRAAGELGKSWIYNDRVWYSFSIGYAFLGKKD